MTLQFFLPMNPPTHTHQQGERVTVNRKTGRAVHYADAELKDIRQKFLSALTRHAPPEPFKGGVRFVTKWCYPVTGKHRDGDYKLTKPDTENMIKLFKDVMTELHFWKDDAQVASEQIEKFYAELPGIYVYLEDLPKNGY